MKRSPSTPILAIGAVTLVLGAGFTFGAIRSGASPAHNRATSRAEAAPPAAPNAGLHIPSGKQALALALDNVPGGAGVATVGDKVDVLAADTVRTPAGDNHAVRMILQGVEVLRVTGAATAANAPTNAPGGALTFVLAVTPMQAEKLVYHAAFQRLWFSVVPPGQAPLPVPPGASEANALTPAA